MRYHIVKKWAPAFNKLKYYKYITAHYKIMCCV